MRKVKDDEKIYKKIKEFVSENYMEPEKFLLIMNREEIEEDEETFFRSDQF